MKRLREIDIETIAGVIAAITALVLHLLHIADEGLLLAIILVILALILIRDLRREAREEKQTAALDRTVGQIGDIHATLQPPDTLLIGPAGLRDESTRFGERAHGEMVWFNVCLAMFEPQSLFDRLLRPAIENPRVTKVTFILDETERARWRDAVLPKVAECSGADKVAEPIWGTVRESVSVILADTEAGGVEALLSFWGEPFMGHRQGSGVPRYIFRVLHRSELVGHLRELERSYRLA